MHQNPNRRQELAALRAQARTSHRPERIDALAPGQHLESRGVLSGAYRGADRGFLTHGVIVQGERPGSDLQTLCRQPVENMADTFSRSESEARQEPTCATCLRRWRALAAHRTNPRTRAPALLEGGAEQETGRVRGVSGRFQKSTACDFCGKSCAGGHQSDDRVCGGGDGPGFYLCDRPSCMRQRDAYEASHGLQGLAERYAEVRAKNKRQQGIEPRRKAPLPPRIDPRWAHSTREGAIALAESHGHQMSGWEGNVATCLKCGQTVKMDPTYGASGDAWFRGSRCISKLQALQMARDAVCDLQQGVQIADPEQVSHGARG